MKKASKRRILFAARMATMVGAACFAVSGISETLGQEKEKSRPVYIATEEVTETTYMPEVEETTQPTETAKAVETEEPLIASMDWDKDDSYLLCKIAMAEAESEGVKGKALVMLVVLNRVWSDEFPDTIEEVIFQKNQFSPVANGRYDEANALVDALASSKNFKAEVIKSGTVTLQNVSQSQFTKGTDPQVTNGDYSNAFKQVEAYEFNTICVDTEDTSVHLLLQSFINRIFDAASLTQAVVAEKHTVDLETREAHAASFNDEKMHYVLNAHVNEQGTEIDGYQTAARIAGMIGAVAANSSLTHTVVRHQLF